MYEAQARGFSEGFSLLEERNGRTREAGRFPDLGRLSRPERPTKEEKKNWSESIMGVRICKKSRTEKKHKVDTSTTNRTERAERL